MSQSVRYAVTGAVANERISPLLPPHWINTTESPDIPPDFLWENGPRRETKAYRDNVKVYSHLPNGSSLLDSKWALGRLFANCNDPDIGALETHCFRGMDGFQAFAERVGLVNESASDKSKINDSPIGTTENNFPDIMNKDMDLSTAPEPNIGPNNLWVVKDAMANGAGGVWVVGPENASNFATKGSTPLYSEHKYVAQRYVWPPVLFGGRKCHVRVYGLLTSDGRAFIHHRAFLHVANEPFTTSDADQTGSFQDSVHITNCCANSHDVNKFAGEILADFEESQYTERDGQTVVPLAAFFPSVSKCMSFLTQQALPFLHGGQANHGFEYIGIDFMLSYNSNRDPIAYILEINAPPSQDTATGLPHAENLHDEVIRDLTTLWVLPHVINEPPNPGGWRCIYAPENAKEDREPIVPSKAAIINMIRWSMFEKRAQRRHHDPVDAPKDTTNGTTTTRHNNEGPYYGVSTFARSQFPFFSDAASHPPQVFFENAGGSQVAQPVIDAVSESLRFRHRTKVGAKSKRLARQCIRRLLGAKDDEVIILGPNATTIIASLADQYVQVGLLRDGDEVILSTENHCANFDPWVRAAKASGATLKLWSPFSRDPDSSARSKTLTDLLTTRTRIVAIPHASNVLGQVRDLKSLTTLVKHMTNNYCHVVVDGVAAAPHYYADLEHHTSVDWYVISCHKLFGPHLGAMFGRRSTAQHFVTESSTGMDDDASLYKSLEMGTINYEGCAGVIGLGRYFASLSYFSSEDAADANGVRPSTTGSSPAKVQSSQSHCENPTAISVSREEHSLTVDEVKEAYRRIRRYEAPLADALLDKLTKSSRHVRILEGDAIMGTISSLARLPTVSFVHARLSPRAIVSECEAQGISCRCSSFLCTSYLADDFGFDHGEGVVRVSLAHYNTLSEVDTLLQVLEGLPNWF